VHTNRIPPSAVSRSSTAGITLVEITVSMTILAMIMTGVIAVLVQSRRLTEGSIAQNSATTIVQGYIEQMKNMELSDLPYYTSSGTLMPGSGTTADATLPYYNYTSNSLVTGPKAGCTASNDISTRLDETNKDPLFISSGTPPDTSTITPGAAAPSGVVDNVKLIDINDTDDNSDDLQLRLWVWVQDMTGSGISATTVRSITIIYQWRVKDGARFRYSLGSVRTIRSDVPTF
jgi:type II secretory pathway pseudopilin PulG